MEDSDWFAVVETLKRNLASLQLGSIEPQVRRIVERIEWMDSTMDRYCSQTCPSCTDVCCLGQRVFFNRADLLVLLANGWQPPPGQTRTQETEACRYLSPSGCTLSRSQRPYVCVWFLCAPQMELFLEESVGFQRSFIGALQEVRTHRLVLESLYEKHFP